MPRDKSKQEKLWSLIQTRKQSRSANDTTTPIEPRPDDDALLVNVLYQALKQPPPENGIDAAAARALLRGAIAADIATRPAPRLPRRGFWPVGAWRHILAIVALLLVTVAAMAYVVWAECVSEVPRGRKAAPTSVVAAECPPGCPPPPSASKPGKFVPGHLSSAVPGANVEIKPGARAKR